MHREKDDRPSDNATATAVTKALIKELLTVTFGPLLILGGLALGIAAGFIVAVNTLDPEGEGSTARQMAALVDDLEHRLCSTQLDRDASGRSVDSHQAAPFRLKFACATEGEAKQGNAVGGTSNDLVSSDYSHPFGSTLTVN